MFLVRTWTWILDCSFPKLDKMLKNQQHNLWTELQHAHTSYVFHNYNMWTLNMLRVKQVLILRRGRLDPIQPSWWNIRLYQTLSVSSFMQVFLILRTCHLREMGGNNSLWMQNSPESTFSFVLNKEHRLTEKWSSSWDPEWKVTENIYLL